MHLWEKHGTIWHSQSGQDTQKQHPKSHHLYLDPCRYAVPSQHRRPRSVSCERKHVDPEFVCKLYYGLRHPCKKQSKKSHTPGLTDAKALVSSNVNFLFFKMQFQFLLPSIYFQSTDHPSTLRVGHVILVEYIFSNPPGELCYLKQVKTTVLTPVPSWRGWIPRKTGTKAQAIITNRISVNPTSGGSNEILMRIVEWQFVTAHQIASPASLDIERAHGNSRCRAILNWIRSVFCTSDFSYPYLPPHSAHIIGGSPKKFCTRVAKCSQPTSPGRVASSPDEVPFVLFLADIFRVYIYIYIPFRD